MSEGKRYPSIKWPANHMAELLAELSRIDALRIAAEKREIAEAMRQGYDMARCGQPFTDLPEIIRCEYCGSPIGFCPLGEYCTNEKCGYADGYYNPRGGVERYVNKRIAELEQAASNQVKESGK